MVTAAIDGERMAQMRREPTGRPLTRREVELLALVAEGLTYKEIAYVLTISHWTVKTHVKHAMAKLGVNTAAGAVAILIREELI